jgi:hypothetical protein
MVVALKLKEKGGKLPVRVTNRMLSMMETASMGKQPQQQVLVMRSILRMQ